MRYLASLFKSGNSVVLAIPTAVLTRRKWKSGDYIRIDDTKTGPLKLAASGGRKPTLPTTNARRPWVKPGPASPGISQPTTGRRAKAPARRR